MKGVLLDENLPRQWAFQPTLPVRHINEILGEGASDQAIWDYAAVQEQVIVSKDADFSTRAITAAPPPWVVQLRFGNMRRKEFHAFLREVWPKIEGLLPAHKLVCVYTDRIEAFK